MEQPPHERRLGDDEQAYFLGLPASGRPDDRAGDISGYEPPVHEQGDRRCGAGGEGSRAGGARTLVLGAQIAFWLLAPVMVLAALGMILARKPVHSALCLATVMISLAVQYAALDAPFLFAVQIIVYTGAILMLFLFVLMLVGVDAADSLVETIKGQRPLAALAGRRLRRAADLRHRQRDRRRAARTGRRQLGRGRQRAGAGGADLQPVRVRLRGHVGAADHRRAGRHGAGPPRAADAEAWPERAGRGAAQRYADTGQHPGPLPTPGVFARHNAVDTPALLPDGTASDLSVSPTLRARGAIPDSRDLAAPIQRHLARHRSRRAQRSRRRRWPVPPGAT